MQEGELNGRQVASEQVEISNEYQDDEIPLRKLGESRY